MNSATWQELRALRADPVGAAATDLARQATFVAALRQAQGFAEAAHASDYDTKPVMLIYMLSQAGRAIAAAHAPAPGVFHGHGLEVDTNAQRPVLESPVTPRAGRRLNSFTAVAAAVGSPVLQGPAQLGELWAANPDLRDVPFPPGMASWPRALELPFGSEHIVGGEADPEKHPVTTGGLIQLSVDLPGETGSDVAEALKPYPTLRQAFGVKQGSLGPEKAGDNDHVVRGPDLTGNRRANIAVDAPAQTTKADYWRRRRSLASIVELDPNQPQYPAPSYVGFALPEVAGGESPKPLLLWWALLLGLSSLARYEPAAWTAAIDPDTSSLAVRLERILDIAAGRVPERILQSIR